MTELPTSKPPTTTNGTAAARKKTASETYQKVSNMQQAVLRLFCDGNIYHFDPFYLAVPTGTCT